ncbi:MAG: asparagine synthase (glutamine-hydrolyzing) [Chloroflexi bacterium]|nr:asparagine synthase (glutamine-hydrolyzing) [Chloroflexota bacterium]
MTGCWQGVGESAAELSQLAARMAHTLAHRGPDDSGEWVDEEVGIALGFRRLAIIDLSPSGHQPMVSASGRYVIVFNGEIYNYRDLRRELEDLGHSFRGHSDTEVILASCDQWGPDETWNRIEGMFAIGLWDRHDRNLILVRDRLGKKSMYYGLVNGVFLFGSELKALRAYPGFDAEVDRDALSLYLRHAYVPSPYSIYSNIRKLEPGQFVLVRQGRRPETHTYWNVRKMAERGLANRASLPDCEAIAVLDNLLRDAVARRMVADVPLGALLSGGIDSSTVVALMQAQSSQRVKTFTVGFRSKDFDEAEAAKAVALHLGTDHTELYVTPEEARSMIPRLADLYDEPFADSSQIPTFLICALARRHVTVALSGDGGDELFYGYERYARVRKNWSRVGWVPSGARPWVARAIRHTPLNHKAAALGEVLSLSNQDALYRRSVSVWEPRAVAIDGHEPETMVLDSSLQRTIPDFDERMMLLDLATYLPDDILTKVDRASMGVSLEVRAPLLDHRLVEWVWRLSLSFKIRDKQSKWLLKQLLRRYVPADLTDRPKSGFCVPLVEWLRGPLREWAEALLDERCLRQDGFLKPEPIRQAGRCMLRGEGRSVGSLWTVLMFQTWKQRWCPAGRT